MRTMSAFHFVMLVSTAGASRPADAPFDRVTWEMAGPVILPWKTIKPDSKYHGQWLVAGDLDGDGQAELVTSRHDQQVITTLLASKLDGSTLWRWGQAGTGKPGLYCDEPVQIGDLDGDGRPEVWLSIENHLLALDGRDGHEVRRLPLPKGLRVADCIVFANLRGLPRASDIIIKDRYRHVWAYTNDWNPLWDWAPTDYKTAHHPTVMDIDGNGREEVMAGYSLLDGNGKELWTLRSTKVDLTRGHLDCCEIMRIGRKPEDTRLVMTYCGANAIAVLDGRGKTLWEVAGEHFESVDVGRIRSDLPGRQIVVDIAHRKYREASIWLMGDDGTHLGTWRCGDSRHHRLIDWDGDGLDEIVAGDAMRLFNGKGECLARFGPWDAFGGENGPPQPGLDAEPLVLVGDLDGDERPEIILYSMNLIRIYRSDRAAKVPALRLSTGVNVTLY